ncbi:antibiotic biosynthesis monooxygenase family protein [Chromobacterium piscinae]|uniref:antibiotic biosynthesis monooxygenase family protein n=1 Tax=Chromobacterium piscinae TaxID=686831 RepID=UPI00140DF5AD|nr:antibiotic biosynthesis monooxygenase [Chromobacterium piscinae]MCD5329829.1 antibiotic biosynthesis monooxygenase [Chromobacterium piscinae]NHQ83671.1 antibiotic biosynthesis monooxygenase [Chromobacterium vaccinii]
MIAVIFEAMLAEGGREAYLQWAARLAEQLRTMDGFVSIERFQSLNQSDKLLSLSFWRDEAALAAWRNLESHRMAQAAGRGGVFADYRLRVAAVLRDYGQADRRQAPPDSRAAHSA